MKESQMMSSNYKNSLSPKRPKKFMYISARLPESYKTAKIHRKAIHTQYIYYP